KDHIRLSSTTNVEKFAPEVLDDPDKSVIFVQGAVVREQMFANLLGESIKNKSEQGSKCLENERNTFFGYLPNQFDKYHDLKFKIDILSNKLLELTPSISKFVTDELKVLLEALRLNLQRTTP